MGIKLDSKTNKWVVSYYKRHPITRKCHNLRRINIKSKAEANRLYAQLVVDVNKRLEEVDTPLWKDVLSSFYSHMIQSERLSAKSLDSYRLCLNAHTLDIFGELLVTKISSMQIRELIRVKLSSKSPSHQKNNLKYIRAVFNFAVESGYLSNNPTPIMKFSLGNKIKKVLTEGQVKILLQKAKDYEIEWYPHWVVALYTGMRNGELYALTWDKVNFENRQILVDCAWNNKDGFKSTKSEDDRIVEIAHPLLTVLKQLKLKHGIDVNFVLPRIDKWDKGEQARELRMFLTGLGLPSVRFHDLRATWATLLLSKGVAPVQVMIMGGWKDIKTMMIYVRKAGVDIKGATDCLNLHNPNIGQANILNFEGLS